MEYFRRHEAAEDLRLKSENYPTSVVLFLFRKIRNRMSQRIRKEVKLDGVFSMFGISCPLVIGQYTIGWNS